jgi:hypothetical protein
MPHRLLTPLFVVVLLAGTASCKLAGRAFGPQDEGGLYLIIAVKAEGAQLEQAEDAALVMKSGGLPAPIEALEEGLYKP